MISQIVWKLNKDKSITKVTKNTNKLFANGIASVEYALISDFILPTDLVFINKTKNLNTYSQRLKYGTITLEDGTNVAGWSAISNGEELNIDLVSGTATLYFSFDIKRLSELDATTYTTDFTSQTDTATLYPSSKYVPQVETSDATQIISDLQDLEQRVGIVESDITSLESDKQDKSDNSLNTTNKTIVGGINELKSGKQDNLVSGTNIKTINGESLLGSGNLEVITDISGKQDKNDDNLETTSKNVVGAINENKGRIDNFTSAGYITKDVNNLTYYTLSTGVGNKIALSINSSTFVVTLQLLNANNEVLSTGTIDLPLESVVVGGSYDSETEKVVLTLQNGNTIEFSVADLVSGLQTEITSSNKLDADLVDDTNSTNKFTNASEKSTWNGKQDALTAGTNITINNNTISATDTTYTAGDGLSLSGGQFSLNKSTLPIEYIDETALDNPLNLVEDLQVGKIYLIKFKNNVVRGTFTGYNGSTTATANVVFSSSVIYQLMKYSATQIIFENCNLSYSSSGWRLNSSYYAYMRATIDTNTESATYGEITNFEAGLMLKEVNGKMIASGSTGIYAPNTSGTSGQILQSNGSNQVPTWVDNNVPQIVSNTLVSTWVADSTYTGFEYKADITINGITANDVAEVIFGQTEAVSGNYANVTSTSADTITIYSKVNTSITIPTIIIVKGGA